MKKNLPVNNYLQILQLFSSEKKETGLGSNEILRLTGKTDKQQVYRDIKALINAKILYSKRGRHLGYKQPKYLTETGEKIRQFVKDINRYRNSCAAFRNKIAALYTHIYGDDKTICKKRFEVLVNVDNIDIDKVRKDYDNFVNLTSFIAPPTVVINNILLKYCKLLKEFDEKRVNDILAQTVIEAITGELQEMAKENNEIIHKLSLFHKNPSNNDISAGGSNIYQIQNVYSSASNETYACILSTSLTTNIFDFHYLQEEFKEMAKMSLRIMPPDKTKAKSRIKGLREEKWHKGKLNADRVKTFISICEEGYSID